MFDFRPIKCPTCEVDDAKVLGIRRRRTGAAVETRIVCCRRCGLIYPNPFPYPTQNVYDDPEGYFSAHDTAVKLEQNRAMARELASIAGGQRLLDVGSGRGELLAAAIAEGFDAHGTEISPTMADDAERIYGVRPAVCALEDYEAEPFDVIVLNAVIEHVHNPDSFVAAARRLIKDSGVLYIDTPREPHLLTMVGRAMGTTLNLSPTWEPFHVFGFNPRSLTRLLAKHDFRIDRVAVRDSRAAAPGLASIIMRAANLTPWAANMYAWARPTPARV